MDKREARIEELRPGQRVLVMPKRAGVPMGPGQAVFPMGGKQVAVSDYVIGLLRRDVASAYVLSEPAPQPQPVDPPPVDESPSDEE